MLEDFGAVEVDGLLIRGGIALGKVAILHQRWNSSGEMGILEVPSDKFG